MESPGLEHHITIKGRRWRATDPGIPAQFQSELVHELMDARRAVKAARAGGDSEDERHARARVQDAKVALGERGYEWWDPAAPIEQLRERLASAARALLRHRAASSTICPSDMARVAGGSAWRDHMDLARDVAFELQSSGIVEVRQSGARVERATEARGPLRVARGADFS